MFGLGIFLGLKRGQCIAVLNSQRLLCRQMTLEDAKEVCSWDYPGEYRVYNNSWEEAAGKNMSYAKEQVRASEFWSLVQDRELVGFFRLHPDEESVMLGLGLRPDLCGQGNGRLLLEYAIQTFQNHHPNVNLHLMVREWNERAIRCYASSGFVQTGCRKMKTPSGEADFLCMEYRGK